MQVCVCLCVFVCDTAQEALLKGMYKAANSSLHTHTHTHTHTRTHQYNLNHKALLCCPVRKGFGCACLCVCVCACPCACVCVCVCVCVGGVRSVLEHSLAVVFFSVTCYTYLMWLQRRKKKTHNSRMKKQDSRCVCGCKQSARLDSSQAGGPLDHTDWTRQHVGLRGWRQSPATPLPSLSHTPRSLSLPFLLYLSLPLSLSPSRSLSL